MESLRHDIHTAVRSLRKAPGFTLLAVLTLMLGIGATTAIFTVIGGVLLRPLPFQNPHRLMVVRQGPVGQEHSTFEVSYPGYRAWRERAHSFTDVAAWPTSLGRFVFQADDGTVDQVRGSLVTWNLFSVLGTGPMLGRDFTPADDVVGAAPVALVSDALWRTRFGASRDVLGGSITLDGRRYTIVGVMPPGFAYPVKAQIWMPVVPAVGAAVVEDSSIGFLNVVARLAPGVRPAAAAAEVTMLANQLAAQQTSSGPELRAILTPIRDTLVDDVRRPLAVLFVATGLVLLVACVNVANLLLMRGGARRRELALRTALGASRVRLIRPQLLEALLLSLSGAGLGVGLSSVGVRTLVALLPGGLYRSDEIGVDPAVLIFAVVVAVLAAAVAGLIPALQPAPSRPLEALQAGSARSTRASGEGGGRTAWWSRKRPWPLCCWWGPGCCCAPSWPCAPWTRGSIRDPL